MTRSHRRWHAWLGLALGPLIVVGFVVGLLARPTPVAEPAPLATPGGTPKATTKPQP